MQDDVFCPDTGSAVANQFDLDAFRHDDPHGARHERVAISVVPTPKATQPSAPLCGVCESVPTMS
jgi:hypothetical protein